MDTLDRIKGSLLGGAAGDALGYPVEFVPDHAIRDFYGPEGITAYRNGQGWISDDTQMTLFTAAGILSGDGFSGVRHRVAAAYQDWLITQRHYQQIQKRIVRLAHVENHRGVIRRLHGIEHT